MDSIIRSIFKSCDEKNTNLVHVSSLVYFIKPYMLDDLSKLVELQTQLDPNNTNPAIHFSFFEAVMSDWIANIQGSSFSNSFGEFPTSFSEAPSPEISQTKANNNNPFNDISLEEQVCKLKFELNKTNFQLELVRQQLAASEEQNESLLAELKVIRQVQQRDQKDTEDGFLSSERENELQRQEEANKREQLQKKLSASEKQQEMYLDKIQHLENENDILKNKLQSFEKIKREGRKSISEMRDSLDVKETEISTLMEVIDNLKGELEEKDEILSFYSNENKLLKQRTQDLEQLLQNNTCRKSVGSNFNTPKLLTQLANPISPIFNLKEFDTSSPLKNPFNESSDVFNVDVVQTIFSPRKSLKDELSELKRDKSPSTDESLVTMKTEQQPQNDDEYTRLQKIIKNEEDIKNNLWQNMKEILSDNSHLQGYKQEYFDLLVLVREKNQKIAVLERQLSDTKEEIQQFVTNIETNLIEQKSVNNNLKQKTRILGDAVNQLRQRKMSDKNVETDKENVIFDVQKLVMVSKETVPKRTNYAKQQIKFERLLEKQEKIEKDLTNERVLNSKLTKKYDEICNDLKICRETLLQQEAEKNSLFERLEVVESEKIQLNTELKICRETLSQLEENNNSLIIEKNSLFKRLEMLESEKINLNSEIDQLKNYTTQLETQNSALNENICKTLNVISGLRSEKILLEKKFKEELFIKNKQLFDLRTMHDVSLQQLHNEKHEKDVEIKNLKKQIEVINVECVVAGFNEELKRAVLEIIEQVDIDDELTQNISRIAVTNEKSLVRLENEIMLLSGNITLIILLLRNVSEKYIFLSRRDENGCEHCNDDIQMTDDSFVSCTSETHIAEIKMSHLVPLECDSFLENMYVEDTDLRLSLREIEEKFQTLTLMLTVDCQTAENRYIREEKNIDNLILNFFTVLNDTINLLSFKEKNPVHKFAISNLNELREIGEDMLRSSFQCGILHYERRTTSYWKLIRNYVAILRQQKDVDECCCQMFCEDVPVRNTSLSSNWFGRITFYVCAVLLILVFFFVMFIVYVDYSCPKSSQRTCPIKWMMDMITKKTNLDDFCI